MRNTSLYGFAGITCLVIALVYWPVVHAGFVWDDWIDFHDRAWLSYGDGWEHFIFRGFDNWTHYFRPLVVALFTLQVRMLGGTPGAMHAVSLGIHLVNTLLVGALSWRCSVALASEVKRTYILVASMLLYGLHPVLIEPVAWIGCQFDLVVTMLTLLGLLANTAIQRTHIRAVTVAVLFFLAACAKESAVSFPLILLVFDWALHSRHSAEKAQSITRTLTSRNWLTVIAMFLAGVAYLAFRHWAIGRIVNPFIGDATPLLGRLQEVCFLYLHYWRTLIWPMSGMSPIHPIDVQSFNVASLLSLLVDASAIGIVAAGFFLAFKRSSAIGHIVMMVTAALLPVLHIASTNFDSSLYHERYAMTGLAVVCTMLPLVRWRVSFADEQRRFIVPLLATVFFWLSLAVINIRVTLPLWSNNVNLWHWALITNPDSVEARDGLLSAYIDSEDYVDAHKLIDQLLADHVSCANCMLNAAIMAINENDPKRAAIALEEVRKSRELVADRQMFRSYLFNTGRMLVLQGKLHDAEQMFRAAMKMDLLDPQTQLSLAMTLASEGKQEEARTVGEAGIAMLRPDKRRQSHVMLEDAISAGKASSKQANSATGH